MFPEFDGERGGFASGVPARNHPHIVDDEGLGVAARRSSPIRRPPALSASPDSIALLRALQGRWKQAMLLGTVCAVFATLTAWFLVPPPRYKTSVLLQIST